MSHRHLPVRPDLDQLKHQAKDLLRAFRQGDPDAVAEFAAHHHKPVDPTSAKLADAHLVLARAYQAKSWPQLVLACRLIDAIWRDDISKVRDVAIARYTGDGVAWRPTGLARGAPAAGSGVVHADLLS